MEACPEDLLTPDGPVLQHLFQRDMHELMYLMPCKKATGQQNLQVLNEQASVLSEQSSAHQGTDSVSAVVLSLIV